MADKQNETENSLSDSRWRLWKNRNAEITPVTVVHKVALHNSFF